MNRRSFLQGTIAAVVASGDVLVRLATPAEATQLVAKAPVMIGQPNLSPVHPHMVGQTVYMLSPKPINFLGGDLDNLDVIAGEEIGLNPREPMTHSGWIRAFVPVGVFTEISCAVAVDNVVSAWDAAVELIPGRMIEIARVAGQVRARYG